MKTLHLKPAAGLIVRDPETGKPLSPDGETKPDTTYWRRRLRDGDVAPAAAEKRPPAPKPNAKGNGGKAK